MIKSILVFYKTESERSLAKDNQLDLTYNKLSIKFRIHSKCH